jgi:hypothetical protein
MQIWLLRFIAASAALVAVRVMVDASYPLVNLSKIEGQTEQQKPLMATFPPRSAQFARPR